MNEILVFILFLTTVDNNANYGSQPIAAGAGDSNFNGMDGNVDFSLSWLSESQLMVSC